MKYLFIINICNRLSYVVAWLHKLYAVLVFVPAHYIIPRNLLLRLVLSPCKSWCPVPLCYVTTYYYVSFSAKSVCCNWHGYTGLDVQRRHTQNKYANARKGSRQIRDHRWKALHGGINWCCKNFCVVLFGKLFWKRVGNDPNKTSQHHWMCLIENSSTEASDPL